MNVRKATMVGLMGLMSAAPVKAQKLSTRSVEVVSETGIMGVIKQDASFYTGMNIGLPSAKNYFDAFAGVAVQPDKKASFLGLVMNNYNHTKHLSSWVRGVANISNRGQSGFAEISPVRVNTSIKNLSLSVNPALAVNRDFKNNNTTLGINSIIQGIYKLKNDGQLFVEANYQAKPGKSLSGIEFGNIPKNTSYMISYMKKF